MKIADNQVEIEGLNAYQSRTNIPIDKNAEKEITNDRKKILLKSTRFFQKNKYLIIVYLVERKIKKIVTNTLDAIFEEFEVFY